MSLVETLPNGKVRIARILKVVAECFGLSTSDLISARRTGNLILPRHIVYCLCKQLTLQSLPAIGRSLGGRDHTTILYGVRKIERLMLDDPELRAMVDALIGIIGGTDQSDKRKSRAHLTPAQVLEIRASKEGPVELGKRYGVTHSAIYHVRTKRTWMNLNEQS